MNMNILAKGTKLFSSLGLKFKKNAPTIMVVGGAVGSVVGAVVACNATLKVNDVISEEKKELEAVKAAKEKLDNGEDLKDKDGNAYTIKDYRKDLTIVKSKMIVKTAKLYAPAIAIEGVSLFCILGGHRILNKRYISLGAAYSGTLEAFNKYRGNVKERFGEDLDKELRFGTKNVEKEITDILDDGTSVTKTEIITESTVDQSDYAKFYDDGCTGWTKDPEANLMFLRRQQDYATDRLKKKGHLYLNEVYDMLGIQRTKAGQIVGWIYDEKNPIGDNRVDFGIYNLHNERNRAFVNGYERTILLDFNVDGNILDLMN